MSEQNQNSPFKHIMIYFGILLVLVGTTAVKEDNLTLFFIGLALLAFQVFEFKGVPTIKLVMAEFVLAVTLGVAAVTQLLMAKTFKTPQAYLVVLLIGVVLILVDSIRKLGEPA